MCVLCEESGGEPMSCPDCGRLICYDVEHGDDILQPAYVDRCGDLYCQICGSEYDRELAEYEDAIGFEFDYPHKWHDPDLPLDEESTHTFIGERPKDEDA